MEDSDYASRVPHRAGIVGIAFIRESGPDEVPGTERNFHGLLEKPEALLIIFIVLARIALHFIVVQAEP
jgi:hypothetical protein